MLEKILPVLSAALALCESGSPVESFLSQAASRLTAAQVSGAEPSDVDWAVIDQAAAAALLKVKGYVSMTAALLQTPQAQSPTPPSPTPAAIKINDHTDV
jgi:hypothetical protein